MLELSSVDKLPIDIVIELKRKLRARQETQKDCVQWLKENGHNISKSALNRYAIKLFEDDATRGLDRTVMSSKDADLVALFEELSELKAREAEIIALLQSAMITTKASQD